MSINGSDLWTLYDTARSEIWGGAFATEEQARRWRDNVELPPTIVPMPTDKALAKRG